MREISLHILDLVQNSISADASVINLTINESPDSNFLSFVIEDNGKGMSEEFLKRVTDPFVTSRTTRSVGMGISLTKAACLATNGSFDITSKLGEGTKLVAGFEYNHIDRQPLGDVAETVSTLIMMNPDVDFNYKHIYNNNEFLVSTMEIKNTLGDVPINELSVINWIKEYINENLTLIMEVPDNEKLS